MASVKEHLHFLTGLPVSVEGAAVKGQGLGVGRLAGLKGEPQGSFRDICGGFIPD